MKKLLIVLFALGLVSGMNTSALGIPSQNCPPPAGPAAVDFICATVGDPLTGDTFLIPLNPVAIGHTAEFSVVRAGYRIDLSALLDADPAINYSIGATNFSASPLAFSFTFSEAIVPAGSSTVTASLAGLLTDNGGDGVTVTAAAGSNISVYSLSGDGGATFTNMGVDVGSSSAGTQITGTSFYSYGPYAAGPQLGPDPGAGVWDTLKANVDFVLSAGDIAQLSGSGTITPNPEPGTLLLIGSGLLGAGAWGRRRFVRRLR
jgi:hypothetical protein